jgi:hypothetical protein
VTTTKILYGQGCEAMGLVEYMGGSIVIDGTSFFWTGPGTSALLGDLASLWIPFLWQRWGTQGLVTVGKLSNLDQMVLTDLANGRRAYDAIGGFAVGQWAPLGVPDIFECPGPPLNVLITMTYTQFG